jgi:hypothetical protein
LSNQKLAPSKRLPIYRLGLLLFITAIPVAFFVYTMGPRIEVTPGPWEDIPPGTPRPQLNVKVRVVKPGEGRKVEAGDLVRVSVKYKIDAPPEGRLHPSGKYYPVGDYYPQGAYWVWIATRHDENASIHPNREGFAALLLGYREGDILSFDNAHNVGKNTHHVDTLPESPIGNADYFRTWKPGARFEVSLSDAQTSSESQVEILNSCKSRVQRRIVHLFDDSTIFVCGGLNISCGFASSAREGWVEEGRVEAQCPDGSVATFRYGPKGVRIKEWSGPVNPYNYFQAWILKEWMQKTPAQVQLQPPEK